jgi:hypothetical protein
MSHKTALNQHAACVWFVCILAAVRPLGDTNNAGSHEPGAGIS